MFTDWKDQKNVMLVLVKAQWNILNSKEVDKKRHTLTILEIRRRDRDIMTKRNAFYKNKKYTHILCQHLWKLRWKKCILGKIFN